MFVHLHMPQGKHVIKELNGRQFFLRAMTFSATVNKHGGRTDEKCRKKSSNEFC